MTCPEGAAGCAEGAMTLLPGYRKSPRIGALPFPSKESLMNRHLPPACPSCKASLPRAAAHRCPTCRHPLGGISLLIRMSCRRCGAAIEKRAGAAATCLRCRSLRPSRLRPQDS